MALEVTIPLSIEIYERAERLAQQQHQDVVAVIETVLDQALPFIDEDYANQSDEDEAMYREGEAYRRLHPELKEKYLGQYVAIYGGKLVDHDSNQVDLYLRVEERYPDEFVWIAPVLPEPEEVYVIHSPRLVGDY